MIKNPMNTKVLYQLVQDIPGVLPGTAYSETHYEGEVKAEAIKAAKKLGEDVVWHVIEKRCVACSDRAHKERDERLYGKEEETA